MKLTIINYDLSKCLTFWDKIRILSKVLQRHKHTCEFWAQIIHSERMADRLWRLRLRDLGRQFFQKRTKYQAYLKKMDGNDKTQNFKQMLDFWNIHHCVTDFQLLKVFARCLRVSLSGREDAWWYAWGNEFYPQQWNKVFKFCDDLVNFVIILTNITLWYGIMN